MSTGRNWGLRPFPCCALQPSAERVPGECRTTCRLAVYFIAVTTVTVIFYSRNLRWAPFAPSRDDASAGRESTFQSNTAHATTGAMVKKKGKNKSMDTGDDGFTYGEFAEACGQGKNGPSQPKLVCAFYPLLISVPCAFYSQVNLSRADRRRSV